jgi:hypothetical protein
MFLIGLKYRSAHSIIYPGLFSCRKLMIGHATSYTIDVNFTGKDFLETVVIKYVGLKLLRATGIFF